MSTRNAGLILLLATLVTTLLILALGSLPAADNLRATPAAEGHAELEPQGLLRLAGLVKPLLFMGFSAGLTLLILKGWNGRSRVRKNRRS
ncbi:hypothetical protein [Deinococcus yavapaiensis]|uniref:Uncharacterized protein n=1 Tax=Deinococcus yavapaiensis KR-236 TaxID=694435 RepID=A0A318S332_9DEIO|nr:hypothetical protein [Deinococcus yavapaiensis]PYE48347.1 hypothetical protein DES52_13117 [Deinococcus yavapaiensis KR-236]